VEKNWFAFSLSTLGWSFRKKKMITKSVDGKRCLGGSRARLLLAFCAAAVVLCLPPSVWAVRLFVFDNVSVVENGQLYRSSQMSESGFLDAVHKWRLASVVNLRGAHPGTDWYDAEVRACTSAGVQHFDIQLSARSLPPPEKILSLLKVLDRGPYPMLIHCRSGRTAQALPRPCIWWSAEVRRLNKPLRSLLGSLDIFHSGKLRRWMSLSNSLSSEAMGSRCGNG
jgi:hypothetical protein